MSRYGSTQWLANRRATGHGLARARAQGEADHARLNPFEQVAVDAMARGVDHTRDPMERAGYAPESLESPTNLESRK